MQPTVPTPAALPRTGEEGFLYVEVLISLFIFALAMLAVVPMLTLAAHENAAANDITYATLAAQATTEQLKATPLAALTSGNDTLTLYGTKFARTWTVTDNLPHPGMKTVVVTVVPNRMVKIGENRPAEVTFFRAN